LWIEFEVSRADPVANHAKFATSHLFHPQPERDVFVSMVSSHVQRGRRNLAANTIALMRCIGMNAFQTTLFPAIAPVEIKRLNHLDSNALGQENLDIVSEIERAISVSETILATSERRIHFAGELAEVMLNVRRWNKDLQTAEGQKLWGKRTITYFVVDPFGKQFAPSKFCAYVAIPSRDLIRDATGNIADYLAMSVQLYVSLDGVDSRFDGRRAQSHLVKNLGMVTKQLIDAPGLFDLFNQWMYKNSERINIHPNGPVFLMPPTWFF
jgi:hypothetical protein